eukprot:4740405-Prymnesium_polylepis.1
MACSPPAPASLPTERVRSPTPPTVSWRAPSTSRAPARPHFHQAVEEPPVAVRREGRVAPDPLGGAPLDGSLDRRVPVD